MGADFTLHILVGASEEDLRQFRGPSLDELANSSTRPVLGYKKFEDLALEHMRIENCPDWPIGVCSFLKAGLSDDSEKYIPGPIDKMCDILGDGGLGVITLTDEVIKHFLEAVLTENTTQYSGGYLTTEDWAYRRFAIWLNAYKGQKIFQIAW